LAVERCPPISGGFAAELALANVQNQTRDAIRHSNIPTISEEEGKYLVHFHIEDARPLIGNE